MKWDSKKEGNIKVWRWRHNKGREGINEGKRTVEGKSLKRRTGEERKREKKL